MKKGKGLLFFFAIFGLVLPLNIVSHNSESEIKVIGKVENKPIQRALSTNLPHYDEPTIQVHYNRDDGEYEKWCLWMWAEGKEGAEYPFNYSDSYGAIAYYPLSTFANAHTIGFIVKQTFESAGSGNWVKDGQSDRFLDIDMLVEDSNDSYHIYLIKGNHSTYTNPERTSLMKAVKQCQFEDNKTILVTANDTLKSVSLTRNGVAESATINKTDSDKTFTLEIANKAEIFDAFEATIVFVDGDVECAKPVSIRNLYDAEFDAEYNYDGELGAIYSPTSTTFKVWSPVSTEVVLRLYDNGTPKAVDATRGSDSFTAYPMSKGPKGVYSVTVNGDLEGKYYTYFAKNTSYPEGKEAVDPYAKSAGVNGLRGMVVDFSKTNPTGWGDVDYLTYDRKELTVYETHIAELTCSDTWGGTAENAKKFKGFYETGTTYTSGGKTVKTGFDHIKELGVNAVQIIPFFDQANDETNMTFNWGYNPLNYNVVEGGYSSDPYDGYARIKELKELVKAYNEAGITIIMDVVYNHVNGLSGSNFDVLMPYYYFRYVSSTGEASNGSGCGNETASDKYMFRKFMIDSTKFWTSEYKLGGFRFDLMAIHDVETMNQLTAANKAINPHVVIYGEPWAGGQTAIPSGFDSASQANLNLADGYGAFNDFMRDAMISGGLSSSYSKAWVTQTKHVVAPDMIAEGLKGITHAKTNDPNKAVVYVTCHDNYTLHDRAVVADATLADNEVSVYKDEATLEKMNALANSLVFTSQGTSFMLAGEEMLRTKIVYDDDGNPKPLVNARNEVLNIPEMSGNSYNSCYKTNEINYAWKIAHPQLFSNYQKLIALKQNATGLHSTTPNNVEVLEEGKVIKMSFVGENNRNYVVYHRNGVGMETKNNEDISILSIITSGLTACTSGNKQIEIDTTGYQLYLDTLGKDFKEGKMVLDPFETIIIYK